MNVDLRKHSHLTVILVSVLIGMVAMATVLYYPRIVKAHADGVSVQPVTNWQEGFSRVAEAVLPAVVSIQGKSKAQTVQVPDFEEFFRQFPGLPFGAPEGQGGPPAKPRQLERSFLGSGWVYSADGYIVTNAHVVRDAASLMVQLHDSAEDPLRKARVIGYDLRSDLAIIKVDVDRPLPFLQLASSKQAKVGQWVMALGNPFSANLEQTATTGIISAKGRHVPGFAGETGAEIADVLQTDAAINPGNSGGPLVDMNGRVVGINESIVSPNGSVGGSVGIGFAISSDTAATVLPSLIAKGKVVRGWLGIAIADLNENKRDFYKAPQGGVLVMEVNAEGPSAQSDLQADDVIVKAGDTIVRKTQELQSAVAMTTPGSTLRLTIIREGQTRQVDVRLGEIPDDLPDQSPGDEGAAKPETTTEDMLGITGQTVTPGSPAARALKLTKGVLVVSVSPDGLAAEDLQAGDVITRVNRTAVANVGQYEAALRVAKQSAAQYVILRVARRTAQGAVSLVVDINLE